MYSESKTTVLQLSHESSISHYVPNKIINFLKLKKSQRSQQPKRPAIVIHRTT